jgi:hypothetical protein
LYDYHQAVNRNVYCKCVWNKNWFHVKSIIPY